MEATIEAQTADELMFARRNAFVPATPEQAQASLMLASAYGHEWAQKLRDSEENGNLLTRWLSCKATIGEIAAFVLGDNYGGGEAGPWPVEDGYSLIHTTGTGRTVWTVTADGTVIIEIRRPGMNGGEPYTVLRAEVGYAGAENFYVNWDDGDPKSFMKETAVPYGEVAFYERHVYAMRKAIAALVGDWHADEDGENLIGKARADEAVAPLWDLAIPEFDERSGYDDLALEKFLPVAAKACRTAANLPGAAVIIGLNKYSPAHYMRGELTWKIESHWEGFSISELSVCYPLPKVWTPEHEARLRQALAFAEEFLGKCED